MTETLVPGVAEQGLLRRAEEFAAQVARYQALLLETLAEYRRLRGRARDVPQEVALVLAVTERAAARQLDLADALVTRLPRTLAALRRGEIDADKASKVHEPTACLTDEQAREVDARMAARLVGKNPPNLRAAVQRQVHRVDPEGAAVRARRRRAERRVELVHGEDGMATLVADLPVEVASSIYARLDRAARKLRVGGEVRTLDQLRADVLADTLLSGTGLPAGPKADIHIYVDLATLAGLNTEPAEVAGHGPIPAWLARQLAHEPGSTWRRIITDPATGAPVDAGRQRYRPPAVTDDFVRVRDRECRHPGCRRPAQFGDLDHAHPRAQRGTTNATNLVGYCRRHHRTKHTPTWHHWLCPETGRLTVTTPAGAVFTSDPEPLHEPRT
ncbi:uncharacterized protein DUF222 [Prauserella shujinwangii]|uniref:Uncharacterized protein DUF222 n=1 Tax=Prauserella shujinwangii TaxID=1453103 RepID=A0A2T0LYX5_9PSEU|nr:HNH endonuclease signature motif containing protein [Prauserella shujinwangii]PRX49321.1 uncharacterized protein DUF222 [Prauserella shujinwangii]